MVLVILYYMSKKRTKRKKGNSTLKKTIRKKIGKITINENVKKSKKIKIDIETLVCGNYEISGDIGSDKAVKNIHFLWMIDHALGGTWRKDFFNLTKLCYESIKVAPDRMNRTLNYALFYEHALGKEMKNHSCIFNDVDETLIDEISREITTEFLGYNPIGSNDFSEEEVHKFYCTLFLCHHIFDVIKSVLNGNVWLNRNYSNGVITVIEAALGTCYEKPYRYFCLRCALKRNVVKYVDEELLNNTEPSENPVTDENEFRPTPFTNFIKLNLRDYEPKIGNIVDINSLGFGEFAQGIYYFNSNGLIIWTKALFITAVRDILEKEPLSIHIIMSRINNDGNEVAPTDQNDYMHLDPRWWLSVDNFLPSKPIDGLNDEIDKELLKYKDYESYDKLMTYIELNFGDYDPNEAKEDYGFDARQGAAADALTFIDDLFRIEKDDKRVLKDKEDI